MQGGGDGWRVSEVSMSGGPSPFAAFGDATTIAQAEDNFTNKKDPKLTVQTNGQTIDTDDAGNDDDDGYWDRYDATPARTPAQKASPAPYSSGGPVLAPNGGNRGPSTVQDEDDEDYYAQYDQVQPAMDNHDPDEEAVAQHYAPPLGLGGSSTEQRPVTNGPRDLIYSPPSGDTESNADRERVAQGLLHPRPDSSASSNGSQTVARLEEEAGRQDHNEFGVKQHISRSVRSLYMLSRASGIEKEEFERIVKREIDLLGMMGDVE